MAVERPLGYLAPVSALHPHGYRALASAGDAVESPAALRRSADLCRGGGCLMHVPGHSPSGQSPSGQSALSQSPADAAGSLASTSPSSAAEAAAMALAGLSWLAEVDATSLTAVERVESLRALERAESARTAAQASVLSAFTSSCEFEDDGHGSARTWLKWQTRVTGAAAAGAVGWMRRLQAHRTVHDALKAGQIASSWAREMCDWTDLLPAEAREDCDVILLAAAADGADLADLAGLAEEMRRRLARPDQDSPDDGFDDRSVRLDIHYRGAGKLDGDLTPRCSAAVQAVLDALAKKAGPEDTRTLRQRQHDALEEAMRRLIAAGCVPDRAGQPTQIQLQMTLQQLAGGTAELAGGTSDVPHSGAQAGPGDDCDASIAPVVAGHVDYELLDRLAGTVLREQPADRVFAGDLILRNFVALLSGPAGLAARLRASKLTGSAATSQAATSHAATGPAATISLPLDVGAATDTIPAHLRRAVILRDRHCAFPSGCDQPRPPA